MLKLIRSPPAPDLPDQCGDRRADENTALLQARGKFFMPRLSVKEISIFTFRCPWKGHNLLDLHGLRYARDALSSQASVPQWAGESRLTDSKNTNGGRPGSLAVESPSSGVQAGCVGGVGGRT